MKIFFHGAAGCVTGSKHLLELNDGTNILLDCGMFQGNPKESDKLNRHFGFSPAAIDFLLLSHAHIDHSGLIPRLVADGFQGKIYCTPGTFDLVKILLLDSAHIHESDAKYMNKQFKRTGKPLIEPLYTTDDVYNALTFFVQKDLNEEVTLKHGVKFMFTGAGHIIGAAAINLSITEDGKETRIAFSGDVGRYNDEILLAPDVFPQADYILLESTYGNKLHGPASETDMRLLEIIADTCLKRGGKLVIPSFSVGRTQEIVYALNRLDIAKKLPDISFFVDSPLSVEATEVTKANKEYFNSSLLEYMKRDPEPFDFPNLKYITEAEDSKALNYYKGPCVIISSSGMADAGRVKHHIKHLISDRRNTILIVGYCEPRSLGGKLMNGAEHVTIHGEEFDVNARVEVIQSLSAHGDYNDLLRFISCQQPEKIKRLFLVHGEPDVQAEFATRLKGNGFLNIEIPDMHSEFLI